MHSLYPVQCIYCFSFNIFFFLIMSKVEFHKYFFKISYIFIMFTTVVCLACINNYIPIISKFFIHGTFMVKPNVLPAFNFLYKKKRSPKILHRPGKQENNCITLISLNKHISLLKFYVSFRRNPYKVFQFLPHFYESMIKIKPKIGNFCTITLLILR